MGRSPFRRIVWLLVLSLLVSGAPIVPYDLGATAFASGGNLITNGGAESYDPAAGPEWTAWQPTGWRTNTFTGTVAMTVDQQVYYAGSASVRLDAAVQSRVMVTPPRAAVTGGGYYDIGVWVKTENVASDNYGVRFRLQFYGSSGHLSDANISYGSLTGTQDWTQIKERILVPAGATTVQVECFLWHSTGTVWFDEVTIVEAEPPVDDGYASSTDFPQQDEIIVADDFEDGILDPQLEKVGGDGTLTLEDGKLVLTRTSTSNQSPNHFDGFYYNFHPDKMGITEGVFGLEFTLQREFEKETFFKVNHTGGGDLTAITWFPSGNINAWYRESSTSDPQNVPVKSRLATLDPVKVIFLFNMDLGMFSMWIDGEKLVDNKYFRDDKILGALRLYVYTQNANSNVLKMDDFKVYKAVIPDSNKVLYDANWLKHSILTNELPDHITSDLYLPTVGHYGSTIEWSSSDTSVVSNIGEVAPISGSDKQVTLTATIRSDSALQTKTFDVIVVDGVTSLPEMEGEYILSDDFEDGLLSTSIDAIEDGGFIAESEGKLVVNRTSTANHFTGMRYYIDPDRNNVSGVIGAEFTVERENVNNLINMRLRDAAQRESVVLEWVGTTLKAMYRNTPTATAAWHTIKNDTTGNGPLKINVVLNTNLNMYSVWVDGQKVVENVYTRTNVSGIGLFYAYLQNQHTNTVKFDDFKVYNAIAPSKDLVVYDSESLIFDKMSGESRDMVTADLTLPTVGIYGSNITWSSSNSDVIAVDGQVTKPVDGEVTVILTALIQNGSQQIEKTFDITVVPKSIEMPEVVNLLGGDNFEDGIISPRWVLNPTGGKIVEQSGELQITRDSTGSETIADYYFSDDQTNVRGITGVEFMLRRSIPANVHLRLRSGNDYFAAQWDPAGNLHVMYPVTPNASPAWHNVGVIGGNGAKLTLLFNPENQTFSLWINNKMVLENAYSRTASVVGIQYLRVYMQGSDFTTVSIDNLIYYESLALSKDRVDLDYAWLTMQEIITTEQSSYAADVISSDLNLSTTGKYGSSIRWESSDEALIGVDGTVTRPGNEFTSDPVVTLTAEITANEFVRKKILPIKVLRQLTTSEDKVNADFEIIDISRISTEGSDRLRMSLNFIDEGVYGSTIEWTSSDSSAITQSGRVIRPLAGQPDKTVEVTAAIQHGEVTRTKTFTFTVLADEVFVDPQHMTDEEFFGVWDHATSAWTTKGKFNYDYTPELQPVEAAVKAGAGDYARAKEELLTYIRNRENPYTIIPSRRNTGWVDMLMDDVYHLQGAEYYQGETTVGNEWDFVHADVKTDYISKGATSTYSIAAWYNESSSLEIASKDHPDSRLHPKIEVTVNGQVKTYTAKEDATIRAGYYANTNYGKDNFLKAKMFGEFLDQNTYKSILKFEFPDLKEDDVVESAKLVLYSRAVPKKSGSKKILILKEPTNTWTEETVVWNSLAGYVYSFNGLPDKNDWANPQGADREYLFQMARFSGWVPAALEYDLTKEESYAYDAIRIMEDFITDMGGWLTGASPQVRGGFPRSLDTAIRLANWLYTIDYLADSNSMTAESNTAILKHIWDMSNSLVYHHAASGNWRQQEHMNLLLAALYFPEFEDSNVNINWFERSSDVLESLIYENFFADGSYIESTAGYNVGAFGLVTTYKNIMEEHGQPVSAEYDELLHKAAYYAAMLYNPNGTALQYGDESARSNKPSNRYPYILDWYGDMEFKYIDTYGAMGVEPLWTSRQWPDSRLTIMRSDWTKDSLQLFTNVRGGGNGHGHADDGHVTVYAYGRTLLNDAGIFTYTAADPFRRWGLSTRAHNTVEINDTTQRIGWGKGTIHDWLPGKSFDFLRQSTQGTLGYDHQRTITFVKPDFWIVSDLMTPEDMTKANSYKQLWHMLPGAGLTVNEDHKVMRSNYSEGANIIVASADGDQVSLHSEDGWYDRSYQQLEVAKYGYYAQEEVVGKATFDTVLVPTNNDPDAQATAEALDLGVEKSIATGLKLSTVINGEANSGYYYLSYEPAPYTERTFGKYATDGQMAYVSERDNGEVNQIIAKDASFVKEYGSGKALLRYSGKMNEIAMERNGSRIDVKTTETLDYHSVEILASEDIRSLFINGIQYNFIIEDGYLSADGVTEAAYTVIFDKNGGDTDANPTVMTAVYGGNVGMLPTPPTWAGYAFTGWNTAAAGDGAPFAAATPVVADITVYAQWTDAAYTVAFDKNGGETDANPTVMTATHGGNVGTLPAPPTRAGYTFTGWNTAAAGDGAPFAAATPVVADITVYAQWTDAAYTVAFDKNGGETDANPTVMTATHGGNVGTLPTPPTRTGYTFTGWNTAAARDGAPFAAATPVVADITVYAQWVETVYTVTFDKNGGETDANPTVMTATHGGNVGTLPTPPTRTGYTFTGWNTAAAGDGAPFAAATPVVADITVYAQWTEDDEESSGGGVSSLPSPSCDAKVISTDGTLTLPACRAGEVSLGIDVTVIVPAGASDKELTLAIEKVSDSQQLLTGMGMLVSSIYEILKNVPENFKKTVTLIFSFDPSRLEANQVPVVFYYDEAKKDWVEIAGGKIEDNRVAVEVDHLAKFAVFAVDKAATAPVQDLAKPEIAFSDISGHWAENSIKQAVFDGIVTGYPDGTFKPNHSITRAEFTVMLAGALKLDGTGDTLLFNDQDKIGAWAKRAVALAVQAGIVSGYEDGRFRPDAQITRAEMASMIAKALKVSLDANAQTGFADDEDIPIWAKGAVEAIRNLGIVSGRGGNTFVPNDTATRAEAVVMLLRMLEQNR